MDDIILQKLEAQQKKIDLIYVSVEKTRKYFLTTMIVTVVTFVVPLIALLFVIPWYLGIMQSSLSGI